jgi:hypothetical protein
MQVPSLSFTNAATLPLLLPLQAVQRTRQRQQAAAQEKQQQAADKQAAAHVVQQDSFAPPQAVQPVVQLRRP